MRVAIFDSTEKRFILANSWRRGSSLFHRAGRFDHLIAATSWHQVVLQLLRLEGEITEIQFWGHGSPGAAYVGGKSLRFGYDPSPFNKDFTELRDRINGTLWFRTCATFTGTMGRRFMSELAGYLDITVAAHTFNIGPFHSGLHSFSVGDSMDWDLNEGIKKGTPERIESLQWSMPWDPNTLAFFQMDIPEGW